MAGPGTGVLSFGLVAIPVRIFSAIKDQGIHFNYLHAKCGSRIRNRVFCPTCNQVVERDDLVRGYEVAKNECIKFTEAELESLEAEANKNIEQWALGQIFI
jgi:DNA end-binding protein Ku